MASILNTQSPYVKKKTKFVHFTAYIANLIWTFVGEFFFFVPEYDCKMA